MWVIYDKELNIMVLLKTEKGAIDNPVTEATTEEAVFKVGSFTTTIRKDDKNKLIIISEKANRQITLNPTVGPRLQEALFNAMHERDGNCAPFLTIITDLYKGSPEGKELRRVLAGQEKAK